MERDGVVPVGYWDEQNKIDKLINLNDSVNKNHKVYYEVKMLLYVTKR